MNILVVNDDGINAPGIKILAQTLQKFGNVFVVAPHTEQSGAGHSITIHDPMGLTVHDDYLKGAKAWSLEGKPADCVKFAIHALKLDIDLVVSGINSGPNMGTDIMYSGTIAGASEGVILNIPAIAVSTDFGNFGIAERELEDILAKVFAADILNSKIVISINFPRADHAKSLGIKVTHQGLRPFAHDFEFDGDKYWARGTWDTFKNDDTTDVYAFENGYISITPLQIDRTNYEYMKNIKKKL